CVVSCDSRHSVGELFTIHHRRSSGGGRRQARVSRSRALSRPDQRLDSECAGSCSIWLFRSQRYLLQQADPGSKNRVSSGSESTGVRAPGYGREASLLSRSFEESSRARAHLLSWVLVTVLQLRVAGF